MKGGMSLVRVSNQAMYRGAETTPFLGSGIVLIINKIRQFLITEKIINLHDNKIGLFRVFLQQFSESQVTSGLFSVGLQL